MELIPTGIKGLDKLIGGGLPKGRCILLCGGPGSGKTIFSVEFLVRGALDHGEPGVFISLDESAEDLRYEMGNFGWDIGKLEEEGLLEIIDASPIRYVPIETKIKEIQIGRKEFSIETLIKTAREIVHGLKARRIAIDPLTALSIQFPDKAKRRYAVMRLFQELSRTGCTSIVTSELKRSQLERELQVEEYISHGVIILHTIVDRGNVIRAIQIEKMRGVKIDKNLHPYRISSDGIEVFPDEKIY